MKTAVVYFSLEGNTKYAAERIAQNLNADLIALIPEKEYPKKGLAKFFHGGKAAVFKDTPDLKPYDYEDGKYDQLILGCPVWASKCAAPINTFLADHEKDLIRIGGEKIGILLCQSGNGAAKVIASYKERLKAGNFAAELVLIDPLRKQEKKTQHDAEIDAFCKRF